MVGPDLVLAITLRKAGALPGSTPREAALASRNRLCYEALCEALGAPRARTLLPPLFGSAMHVAMIGTGYVGLVSGACFADFGHPVVCVDKDADKIAALSRGDLPIYEPGLQALVQSNVREGRLKFSTGIAGPVREADAVFVAVGTPSRRGDGHADLSYVYAAAREIAAALEGFTLVVTKSTVPVGTGDEVERIIRETNASADVVVASNPEFLREGAAIRDFKIPDRIVIGTSDERARKVL